MKTLRITGESFNPEVSNITSGELRSDRNVADLIQVSRQNTGSFEYEMSGDSFDAIIAAAMFSTWLTNVCKNGVTRTSFTIEKGWADVSRFIQYKGMVPNTMSLNLKTGAIATGSFGFIGGAATQSATTVATTTVAATTTKVLNCMTNVAQFMEGSTLTNLTGIYVQDLSINVNNNLRLIQGIGLSAPGDIGVGKCEVTGTFNAILNASTQTRLMATFLAGTASKLKFQMTDGASDTMLFELNNIKYESDTLPTPGQDADVIENIGFRALYTVGDTATIKITRAT
jgi:hypothetical protein